MFQLKGKVQHYAWGGSEYIPQLLSMVNATGSPFAEYWLGTHPGGDARVMLSDHSHTSLSALIKSQPARYLGHSVEERFGGLPYLLKVLDVKGMLSIQVHPTKEEAEKGFDREESLGIPLDAPHRNYKDRNHKPEVMVALSEFWLLHGFHPQVGSILREVPELNPLSPIFEEKGLEALYRTVMEMPSDEVDNLLRPLAARIVPRYHEGGLDKSGADFWAARVMSEAGPDFKALDRGVFSIYFFNVLHLRPGQAVFQGAGIPHAYLEGQNVELMSNSDNVLRAGLTPKHIDIPELMKHTRFEFVHPRILEGDGADGRFVYACPVPDFSIDRVEMNPGDSIRMDAVGPEIWLHTSGSVEWKGSRDVRTSQGDSLLITPGEHVTLIASQSSTLFRAWVP
jgi:mannose-6-phosphate isomerase